MKRVLAICGFAMLSGQLFAGLITFSASGPTPASITPTRDAFRVALGGGTVSGANGLFQDGTGSRREINWDGVPDIRSAPNNLPANFFNSNSPRGVVFATPGTGFQVSANAGTTPTNFGNIDPSYSTTFQQFSAQRLFTALGSNITDVNFFVPGTSTPGFVSAFGSVFTDVDLGTSTSLEFFDISDGSLGTFSVLASPDGGLSFLGVQATAGEQIGRVRITSGNAALGAGVLDSNGNPTDLVVMDDFIFTNPASAVPEPSTLLLIGPVLAAFGLWKRRTAR